MSTQCWCLALNKSRRLHFTTQLKALYTQETLNSDIHNKIEIAIEQLETALKLFLSGQSYVSALTLGGAAEEILGMALELDDLENSLQELYKNYHQPGLEWINPPKTWKEFTTDGKNKVRNAVKHLSRTDDLSFQADIQDEAVWMLVRATENYNRLGFKPTDLMHEFEEWFYEHYVGLL